MNEVILAWRRDDEQKESFDISFEKGKGNFAKTINQVNAIIIYRFKKIVKFEKRKYKKIFERLRILSF